MIRQKFHKASRVAGKLTEALSQKEVVKHVTDAPSTSTASASCNPTPTLPYVEFMTTRFSQQLANLSDKVKKAEEQRKSQIDVHRFDKILDVLSSTVVSPGSRLIPVGSAVNGLTHSNSDLDLVFFVTDEKRRSAFRRDFVTSTDFRECDHLFHLLGFQVPLISMEFNNNIKIDIQFPENYQTLRNTNLIRTYAQADDRFQQLYLWLKTVLDALEVRNGRFGLLSSYHLLMLTIHFLQSEQCLSPWTVLPVLFKTNPELVGRDLPVNDIIKMLDSPPPTLDWQSKNKMSVGQLAVLFVDYYINFDFSQRAIFIDRGLTQRRKQSSQFETKINLFDPYGTFTICRSFYALCALRDALKFLRRKMSSGLMLDSFPDFSEAKLFKEDTKWSSWRLQAHYKQSLQYRARKQEIPTCE